MYIQTSLSLLKNDTSVHTTMQRKTALPYLYSSHDLLNVISQPFTEKMTSQSFTSTFESLLFCVNTK